MKSPLAFLSIKTDNNRLMRIKNNFFSNFKRLLTFFQSIRLKPTHLLAPSLLALAASLFEGTTFALLPPLTRGLINQDFSFAKSLKIIGPIIQNNPAIFNSNVSAVFIFFVLLIFISAVLKNVLSYVSSLLVTIQIRRFTHELRCIIFNAYIGFKKSFFDTNSTGHLQQILIGYTEQVASQFKSFHSALYGIFSLLVYLFLMGAISLKITLFVVALFPILTWVIRRLILKIKTESQKFSAAFSLLGKKISNALACILLVKASCSEEREKKWFRHISYEVQKSQIRIDGSNLLVEPIQEICLLVMLLILIGFMAYLVISKKEGDAVAYLVFFVMLRRATESIRRVTSIQASMASVAGPLHEILNVVENQAQQTEKTGTHSFVGLQNKIEFKNLTFRYKDRDILKNLSLEIKKGEMLAIVGVTGSGKSTIAQLLMRFYDPPANTLLVDGHDICDLQVSDLRKKIAFVSQENYLFDTSIEINLIYGCSHEPSSAEIQLAVEKAQLQNLILKLPKGLATEIGERGIQLSGGEKQRLSLARAILRNPEILILDEATSAMDSQTEKLIQKAINETTKNKTSIVIAHRLTTIQHADKIVVLDHGAILESGTFEELTQLNGHFKKYWDAQMQNTRS